MKWLWTCACTDFFTLLIRPACVQASLKARGEFDLGFRVLVSPMRTGEQGASSVARKSLLRFLVRLLVRQGTPPRLAASPNVRNELPSPQILRQTRRRRAGGDLCFAATIVHADYALRGARSREVLADPRLLVQRSARSPTRVKVVRHALVTSVSLIKPGRACGS